MAYCYEIVDRLSVIPTPLNNAMSLTSWGQLYAERKELNVNHHLLPIPNLAFQHSNCYSRLQGLSNDVAV